MKNFMVLGLLTTGLLSCNLFSHSAAQAPTPAMPAILNQENVLENAKASETEFKLYRLLATDPKNINFSPLSLKISFSMLYPGTKGGTKKLFEQIFGFSEGNENPFHAEYELAQKTNSETSKLEIHNSAWFKRLNDVKPAFLRSLKLQDAYVAKPEIDAMNKWVANATQNKIPKLLESLPTNTTSVLINTIYFKQKWAKPFELTKTTLAQFQASTYLSQNAMTLHDRREVNFFEDDTSKWITLNYENSPFVMYLALPKKRFDLRSVEEKLSAENFLGLVKKMKKETVDLAIPRFKFNQKGSMRSLLTSAGFADLFTKGDYSGALDGKRKLVISDVIQAASIEVNEMGTEASAARGLILKEKAMRTDSLLSKTFIADQPFIFILRNETTGEIYWLGRVYAPLGTEN